MRRRRLSSGRDPSRAPKALKTIFRIEHDGVVGVIESPNEIDPARPLAQQLQVKIGFDGAAARLDAEAFEPRARLVVLKLMNHLHDELGIDG